ncbi:MAG: hypothetical protein ACRDXE_10465 [Acidimicrobiales bacterium]
MTAPEYGAGRWRTYRLECGQCQVAAGSDDPIADHVAGIFLEAHAGHDNVTTTGIEDE